LKKQDVSLYVQQIFFVFHRDKRLPFCTAATMIVKQDHDFARKYPADPHMKSSPDRNQSGLPLNGFRD
jgi:hypothetical protein